MEYESNSPADITGNGTLGPIDVQAFPDQLGLTMTGAFGAGSVQTQISLDGVVFVDEGAAITVATPARLSLPACHSVQFVTTGSTTPVIVVRLGGIKGTGNAGKARR